MADLLNTLGFLSWGLLGSAEGEGSGDTVYILDLGIEIAVEEPEVLISMQDLKALAIIEGCDIAVTVEEEGVSITVEEPPVLVVDSEPEVKVEVTNV